jgi:processive 1,2-diacylglycerol beta-glucosyltransferase
MGRRVLILAAGIGSGHNIAAGVLELCFQAVPEVDAVQKLDILESTNEVYRTLYDDGYFALVEAAPWLVGWGYDASDPPFRLAPWISLWDRINTTATAKAIRAFRPDIVVCTHFLPTRLVSLMLTRGVMEARLAVVTTDYDFQGLWLSSPFNHIFEQLKSQIEGLVAFNRDRYRVLGYMNDMADLIRTATLFVGKPGGLSSSECMAAGLPMVLINPIPGQEVRNSDFLLEEGAAVRCN